MPLRGEGADVQAGKEEGRLTDGGGSRGGRAGHGESQAECSNPGAGPWTASHSNGGKDGDTGTEGRKQERKGVER